MQIFYSSQVFQAFFKQIYFKDSEKKHKKPQRIKKILELSPKNTNFTEINNFKNPLTYFL